MKKEKIITFVICMFFMAAAGIMYIRTGTPGTAGSYIAGTAVPDEKLKKDDDGTKQETSGSVQSCGPYASARAEETNNTDGADIRVYICGAVKNPGVYSAGPDSRVCDILKKAGGFKKKAFREGINLAEKVEDAEKIDVPYISEKKVQDDSGVSDGSAGVHASSEEKESSGKVNINSAERGDLMTLTGIGEAKADAIIEYREKNGSFKSIEDIMNISGIKNGVFDRIKDHICI